MGILSKLFGKNKCHRCGISLSVIRGRQTLAEGLNNEVVMFVTGMAHHDKDSIKFAFECRGCQKIYCSKCARLKLDFVENSAASASIDLNCECGSRQFATLMLKGSVNRMGKISSSESRRVRRHSETPQKPRLTYGILPMDETIKYIDELPPGLDFVVSFEPDLGILTVPKELGMPWSTTPSIVAVNSDESKIQKFVSYINKYFPDSDKSANDNLRVRIVKLSNGGFEYSIQADFVRHKNYPAAGGIRLIHGHYVPVIPEELVVAQVFLESIKKCIGMIVSIGVGSNPKNSRINRSLLFSNQRVFTAGY